jgi:hypothetical protein
MSTCSNRNRTHVYGSIFGWLGLLLILGCSFPGNAYGQVEKDITAEIHTVLPFDGIPAIFEPLFVSAEDADVDPSSPMIGIDLNGEQHAYSSIMLNHHEIVNDVVGGIPIATTW